MKVKKKYVVPAGGSVRTMVLEEAETIAPRNYLIALPADPAWKPETIAAQFQAIQRELGGHVAALYVLGVGCSEPSPHRAVSRRRTALLRGSVLIACSVSSRNFAKAWTGGRRRPRAGP